MTKDKATVWAEKLLNDLEESKQAKPRRVNKIPLYTRFLWALEDLPRYYYIRLLTYMKKKGWR